MERMMTSDNHNRGFERDHSKGKKEKDAKANGTRMSDEEYDKEMAEIAVQLELLMEMLQGNEIKQKYGYVMRKKVKWKRLQEKRNQQVNMQLIKDMRDLEKILHAKLEKKKYERVELQKKGYAEEHVEVLICEPECGPLLFESDKETTELGHMNDLEKTKDLMIEASNESIRTYDFKTDNVCMVAGLEENR